jgi:hypothetical protein
VRIRRRRSVGPVVLGESTPAKRAERFYTGAGSTKGGTSTTGELSFEKEVGE